MPSAVRPSQPPPSIGTIHGAQRANADEWTTARRRKSMHFYEFVSIHCDEAVFSWKIMRQGQLMHVRSPFKVTASKIFASIHVCPY
mgnify:CR=1 FL=1